MAPPQKPVWEMDPHTNAKHLILRKYLNAWLPIITRYNGRAVFIDGFAGPGIYAGGQDGSPVIALKALAEHKAQIKSEVVFAFIESDKKRCDKLREVVDKLKPTLPASAQIEIRNDEYAKALVEILDDVDVKGGKLAPALVFIDPFGVSGIPLSLVKRLMGYSKCEVLINFMSMYAHRFVSTEEFDAPLTEAYGGDDWKAALSLEGAPRLKFLRDLYLAKIGSSARYVQSFAMFDDKGVLIYDLVFASNHTTGIDRMKEAFWKVDAVGGMKFSDKNDPNQEGLFTSASGHDAAMVDFICTKFANSTVPWTVVEEAIRRSQFRIMKKPIKAAASGASPRLTISTGTKALDWSSQLTFF